MNFSIIPKRNDNCIFLNKKVISRYLKISQASRNLRMTSSVCWLADVPNKLSADKVTGKSKSVNNKLARTATTCAIKQWKTIYSKFFLLVNGSIYKGLVSWRLNCVSGTICQRVQASGKRPRTRPRQARQEMTKRPWILIRYYYYWSCVWV